MTWVVYFGAILLLEQVFSNLMGAGQNEIVTVVVTLVLAVLLAPLRGWLETELEKRVNPQPKNMLQGLSASVTNNHVGAMNQDNLILRNTLTYALVATLLILVYFAGVIVLQQLFAAVFGLRSQLVTVLSTLLIAALFVPLRNRIQDALDRSFHHEKIRT